MDGLLVLFIIGVFIFIIFKVVSQNNNYDSTSVSNAGKSDRPRVEDPYLGQELNNNRQIDNLGEYPFISVLMMESFLNSLSDEEKTLAHKLVEVNTEDVYHAIDQMIKYPKFRKRFGLPKYLQVIPIQKFIQDNIFITPSKKDLSKLLESFTMEELRELCKTLEISAARSKKDTVERLMSYEDQINIDYTNYFSINPLIIDISHKVDIKIHEHLNKEIDEIPVKIKPVQGNILEDHIEGTSEKGEYKIAQYGYGSVIYYYKNKPLFRVLGYKIMNRYDPTIYLFSNGIIALTNALGIRNSTIRYFVFLNKEMESIHQSRVINVDYLEPNIIEEQGLIYLATEKGFWIYDVNKNIENHIKNPERKDIYSVLND